MKNQRGFAPVVILLVAVFLGAGTYAVVNRAVLKSYFDKGNMGDKPVENQQTELPDLKDKFENGDIPTEENSMSGDKPNGSQFNNFIDSSLNYSEDAKKPEIPHNLSPEDKKKFTADEAMKPITFRWTALVPKPKESVTYRLRVWQLMQGQNGTQAMKTNKPSVEKDVVDDTEVSVSGIYTGPCKPPYLCDFIWQVQVVGKEVTSEPAAFSVSAEVVSEEQKMGAAVDVQ